MAKDYFQDIIPPNASAPAAPLRVPEPRSAPPAPPPIPTGERTIRNIQVEKRPRPPGQESVRIGSDDIRGTADIPRIPPQHPRAPSRLWIWGAVALSLAVLAAIGLVAFRPTTVTVTPRSQPVVFDASAQFTAYPAATAASGTLSFILETNDLEDSAVVPTSGSTHVEDRASGTVIAVNEYSAQSVKLIKNTRFATPEGLIFRVPADVVIPGKKGTTAGEISITVIADQAGEAYNVGPQTRLTIPGLKSTPSMYTKVYGRSTAAMQGGFAGDRPGTAPGALDSARADVRARLDEKARATVRARTDDPTVTFPGLLRVTYESLPDTVEAGGGLRIHERAHVELPVFPADIFARVVAESVSADAEAAGITFKAAPDLVAHLGSAADVSLADKPLDFTLEGGAQLVWNIDAPSLTAALAGRDEAAFQTIVNGFPAIQEASARIEPFWKSSFPADPSDIKVRVKEPEAPSGA
ncbi:MAG: hypothetical protein AAB665_01665 [Patescibacteria group bacterium]